MTLNLTIEAGVMQSSFALFAFGTVAAIFYIWARYIQKREDNEQQL